MAKSKEPIGFGINPMFKLLLWINTALCVGTLTVMITIAFSGHEPMPKAMERLLNVCEHVFTLTSGAFVGLLGGRVSSPDPPPR
jgi:hypothetical protein